MSDVRVCDQCMSGLKGETSASCQFSRHLGGSQCDTTYNKDKDHTDHFA